MKRNWTGIIGGYVLIALMGAMVVAVGTAYLRAAVVDRTLIRAERLAGHGRPGAALGHLDRVRKWSRMYPALERRRLLTTIRCHVQRLDLLRATQTADAMLDVDVYDVDGSLFALADSMPAELVNLTVLRATADPQAAWDGYVCLIQEARRYQREDLLKPIVSSLSSRFPGGALPHPVHAALKVAGLTSKAQVTPPPRTPARASPPVRQPPEPGNRGTVPAAVTAAPPAAPEPRVAQPEPRVAQPEPNVVIPEPSGQPRWAIAIRDEAPAYDLTGKLARRLDVGTVLEVSETRSSSAGDVALSRICGTMGPRLAVYIKDLETYELPLAEVPRATRDLLVRRVQLQSTTQALRERLAADAIAAGNPYAADYKRTKAAYVAFYKKAKDAKQKMDASTGAAHMTYADRLRAMKTEEGPLLRAFENAKKAYNAWMAENEGSLGAASSPELQQLEAELARVETELAQQ